MKQYIKFRSKPERVHEDLTYFYIIGKLSSFTIMQQHVNDDGFTDYMASVEEEDYVNVTKVLDYISIPYVTLRNNRSQKLHGL